LEASHSSWSSKDLATKSFLSSQVEGVIARASVCQAFADVHFARLNAGGVAFPAELFVMCVVDADGSFGPGRSSHSDITLYSLLVSIYRKHRGWCENDFNGYA
jgi:hypothetical protein